MHKFTQDELALGRYVADGLTYGEIAQRLKVSESTVKARIANLRAVLGVQKKRQIPQVMRELGLL